MYNSNGGIGFGGALFIALLVMKLGGFADISWAAVLTPFWVPLGLAAIIAIGYYLLLAMRHAVRKISK